MIEVQADYGPPIRVYLTEDQVTAVLDQHNLPWKRNGAGEIVVVTSRQSRAERRKAQFSKGHKGS